MVEKILDSSEKVNNWDTTWLSVEVSSEVDPIKSSVDQIIKYTDEEKAKIDDFMQYVYWVDDIIASWQNFANSLEYWLFVTGYDSLSPRLQLHFREIYIELRIKYLNQKIDKIESWSWKWTEGALKNYRSELAELLK